MSFFPLLHRQICLVISVKLALVKLRYFFSVHEKEKSTKADVGFMVKTNARGRNQGRRSEDVAAARRSKSI